MWWWNANSERPILWNGITITINIKNEQFWWLCSWDKTKHNKKWPWNPYPYRILIIGGSGSGKANLLLNLIKNQPDIDKIYLYAKNPYGAKYQYFINKKENVGINQFNDSNDFYWVFKWYAWCLQKYWWLQSR